MIISTHTSPSGKYKLDIVHLPDHKSKAIITNIQTNEVVTSFECGCDNLNHSWFTKDNQEWIQTGKSPRSRKIINLDTKEIFDNFREKSIFSWIRCWLSPNGNMLAVLGHKLASGWEYKFYDFTNPQNGVEEMITDSVYPFQNHNDNDPGWFDDNTFMMYSTYEYLKVDNKLIYIFDPTQNALAYSSEYWDQNFFTIVHESRKVKRTEKGMETVELKKYDVHLAENLDKNLYC